MLSLTIDIPQLAGNQEMEALGVCASGRLTTILASAMKCAGLVFPSRIRGFHLFCHTYGIWMHRYAELDTYGLTRTGQWKDPDSADRHKRTLASAEARRADMLPVAKRAQK